MINREALLRISAVLWLVWGLVHMLAGVMTVTQEVPQAIGGIADAVDPQTLAIEYPAALSGIIGQHGWNLFWFGAVTLIGAGFIWCGSTTAIFVTAMVGSLADIGYFIFMDLGGYVHFVPGTVMTLICALAVTLSFVAHFKGYESTVDDEAST